MRPRTLVSFVVLGGFVAAAATWSATRPHAQGAPAQPLSPGNLADGTTLLPNGWRVAPAGKHVTVGDMPLNVVQSPDSRYLIVTNNGIAKPSFSTIDVANWTVKSTTTLDHAWLGLAWHPDGTRLYSGGAAQNNVQEFAYGDGVLTRARTFNLPPVSGDSFAGGLAVSRDGRTLYVTRMFAQTVSAIDIATGQVLSTASLGAEPYTCVVSPDGKTVYASLWGGSAVTVLAAPALTPIATVPMGEHPSAMVLSADGKRLFVAAGSTASVWVFDTFSLEAIEQISMSLSPEAPPTATPNSLALSPDGQTLLVANADNNDVAVVDVSNSARSFVRGFIPTGWYPTGAIFSRDGRQIFVLSGRGLASASNPFSRAIETRLLGTVSLLPAPDTTTLNEFSRRVVTLAPYSDTIRLTPANGPIGSPIPRVVGGSSPIKHVFYVIRENRTYDQILGDEAAGNGDPALALFRKDVTPNTHALAENFVLLDNFYVDAEISADGHAYSTAAYATDYIEKTWQTYAGNRGGKYLTEGDGLFRNPFGNLSAPMLGYIWDYARRASVTVRSYGEFVRHVSKSPTGDVVAEASVPGLRGLVAPAFAGFDLDITDNKRISNWLPEFETYVANGNLPQLSIVRLGNDHTAGTRPGAPTPRAMVADNDLAVGRLVDTISSSIYWKDSAIFILEDDAQAGPDHVDSHRSVLLVASPFAKRGVVDHTFYSTSSVLRTIELILGLPPMSQYDAAAAPLYNSFQGTPNLAPFRRLMPIPALDEKNGPSAFGSSQSLAMDFSDADRTPEGPLNDIIWRSVKGAASPVPPARRSMFVRPPKRLVVDDDER